MKTPQISTATGKLMPGQRLDHGARADELRDEVDAGDQQRVDRRRDPHRPRLQAEREHVGDGELARVAHPLGEQVEHGQEATGRRRGR